MSIKTEIGYTTPDAIYVRGRNLSEEILGKFDFVDMIWWLNLGRIPEEREKRMINLLLVAMADHGLTPSAITARLTWMGAPESLQGAVAAGLLGAGNNFLGTVQNVAEMLVQEAKALGDDASDKEIEARAGEVILAYKVAKKPIAGIGHNIHVHGDPRVPVLISVSKDTGFFGKHFRLALGLEKVLGKDFGRNLHLNGAGATGAILADMGIDPLIGRGLALVGRAAGLVAHVYEERSAPTGRQVWELLLAQDERNVLPR
jgi:citrate synthase